MEVALNAVGLSSTILKVTWYIAFQYICYLFVWSLGRKSRCKMLFAYGGFSFIVLFVSCCIKNDAIGLDMWGLNAFSFSFGCSMALYDNEIKEYINQINRKTKCIWIGVLTSLFILQFFDCYILWGNPTILFIRNVLKSFISLNLCMIVYCITANSDNKTLHRRCGGALMIRIGNISYELYLAHGTVIYCFLDFFPYNVLAAFFLFLISTISITVLLYYIVFILRKGIGNYGRI